MAGWHRLPLLACGLRYRQHRLLGERVERICACARARAGKARGDRACVLGQGGAGLGVAQIEYSPVGCPGFCADECLAISLIAASQHQRCPAMRACALALTGSDAIDPVLNAANGFADALQDADQRLSPEGVAALMAGRRKSGADRRAPV